MFKHLILFVFLVAVVAGAEPFEPVAGHILFPVMVNSVGPYPCILDLNAEGAVLSSEVAQFLKLEALPNSKISRQTKSGRSIDAAVVTAETLQAAGMTAHDVALTSLDLGPFRRLLGTPTAGIVSGREFSNHLRLDVRGKTLSFTKPEKPLAADGLGVVTIQLEPSGAPLVSAMIDGKHVRPFLLDTTQAAAVSAPESMLRELGLLTDATPRLALDAPAGASLRPGQTQIRLQSVRVGNAQLLEPVCAVGPEGQSARLGLGFLKHFRVQLDYDAKLLRFEPYDSISFPREPALVGFGVGLWKFNGNYWMINVAQGSPAAKAGLVSGAILTAIGDKDLKGLGYDAVLTLLEPHGDVKVTLTALQGDDKHTVELTPEKLL